MSDFKREDRYIIIKRSDLTKVPVAYRSALVDPMFSLLSHLPRRECVVVEHDWPEYHLVWSMIEHRMAGKPVPNFNDWRRADELQQRLTAADERADVLETEVARLNQVKLSLKELAESRADNCSVYRQHLNDALTMAERVRDASLGMQRKCLSELIDNLRCSGAAPRTARGGGDD